MQILLLYNTQYCLEAISGLRIANRSVAETTLQPTDLRKVLKTTHKLHHTASELLPVTFVQLITS